MVDRAMITDLQDSTHGEAARLAPLLIALVNGSAPLLISLLILMPLWLSNADILLPLSPLYAAIIVALIVIFLLGVFLGRIAGISWLHSGIQTLLVAVMTATIIFIFAGQ
jgi:VIT1/CCC1 family predicted Fe2+/Mn2+ transporter